MPAGMYVENFNAPADGHGDFAQFRISPSGLESYPSAGVIQMNGQQIYMGASSWVPASSDFYFEAKFFGPEIPVFVMFRKSLPSSKWEVDFGALTNASPTVAHVVMGRQSGVNCAWLNGQKVYPTFLGTLYGNLYYYEATGSIASPYRSYTLDAFRFAVGTYYDPAAATIPVPTGDLTW